MLSNPAPRPPRCYDPTAGAHRDGREVHLYDHHTIQGLLRDPQRVTSDVTEMLTPEQRDHLHPVSAFVWATDRRTLSGCPGRHAPLRSAMAPWFTEPQIADRSAVAAELITSWAPDQPFDVFGDYAMPLVTRCLADWLGVEPADVAYAVDDQLAAGDFLDDWPALATPEMDDYYRALMARPHLSGIAAAARDMVRSGVITERESWGIVYSIAVSAVATATTITLTVGLSIEHDLWPQMTDSSIARPAIEEAVRLGNPFPHASRFVREPFTVGNLSLQPGDQVLMWLTAANRDLPGPHRLPLDRFDPGRDTTQHVGWGSGYHRCAGMQHARALAATGVTTLARLRPQLGLAAPWQRSVGIDDGYTTAPAVPSGTR